MTEKTKNKIGVCPYVTTQKLLAGKWSIYLLYLLQDGPVRFNELQRRMPENMTHTTLSRQLKQLESYGLIKRQVYSGQPQRVEYALSDIGKGFDRVLDELEAWGNEYIEHIISSKTNCNSLDE
jgi:DNA-binding HxlR family transcriptional regulator